MEEKIMEMLACIIENQNQTNSRLDRIDSHLSRIDGRLDRNDSRFDQVFTQLDRMEANFNQDVIGLLEVINTKLELSATKDDIDYLAGKFGQ